MDIPVPEKDTQADSCQLKKEILLAGMSQILNLLSGNAPLPTPRIARNLTTFA